MNRLRACIAVALVAAGGCEDWTGPPAPASRPPAERPAAGGPQKSSVEVSIARPRKIRSTFELAGNLLPRRRTFIVSEVDGVIESIADSARRIEIDVDGRHISQGMSLGMGESVGKGDVLVQIARADYDLAVSAARARLDKAKADLAAIEAWKRPEEVHMAEAVVRETAARVDETRFEWERLSRLRTSDAVSEREANQAQAAYLMAQAAHARATADAEMAGAGAKETDVAVARAAVAIAEIEVRTQEARAAKTTLRAPYDGVITEVFVDIGARVTAQPRVDLMELLDVDWMGAEVGVPERLAGKIGFGDRVEVLAEGAGDSIPGLVIRVNEKVEPATRTFRVRCGVENHDRRLKAGQLCRVRFELASSGGTLAVPATSVGYRAGEPTVFVVEGDRASLREVRTGLADGRFVEILSGIEPGQQVVLERGGIADGTAIDVRVAEDVPER